jgi:putative glutamine amidotransferase
MSSGERPLLIGVSARIYMPGTAGINVSGIWTKNLHYLEQSVAHWVLSGHAMAVMIPAVTKDSIVTRSDLDLDDYAHTLDGLVLQGGNDVAPETYGETPLHPDCTTPDRGADTPIPTLQNHNPRSDERRVGTD